MRNTRFLPVFFLTSVILAGVAQPSLGQTVLQQIFPNNLPVFEVTVEESAMLSFTLMWNRRDTDLGFAMVCDNGGDPLDWGLSLPFQDRTLRFDAGVLGGFTCTVGLASVNIAAFALNLQVFDQGNLSDATIARLRPVSAEKRADPRVAARILRLEELLAGAVK